MIDRGIVLLSRDLKKKDKKAKLYLVFWGLLETEEKAFKTKIWKMLKFYSLKKVEKIVFGAIESI